MYYFAYGSNLSHKQMLARCPDSAFVAPVALDDYKLVFDGYTEWRGGAVANVVPAEGERVVGGLYEISEEDRRLLDGYEELPLGTYYRTELPVTAQDGREIQAIVYLREPLPIGKPSKEYIAVINEGRRDCGIEEPARAVQLS